MNTKATANHIHMAPRKIRLVVDLVRGLRVDEAQRQLMFSTKAAAKPVLKLLNSAMANAKNNLGEDPADYVIVEALVNEGATFHRYTPRAQGRATPIRKRMSHISLTIGPKVKAAKKGKDAAATEAKAVKEKAEVKKPKARAKTK